MGRRHRRLRASAERDALDLQGGVFEQRSTRKIAASPKRSAEHSDRRKSRPRRSVMSMLTFYVNRAGARLSQAQRTRLEAAKGALRKLFGMQPVSPLKTRET